MRLTLRRHSFLIVKFLHYRLAEAHPFIVRHWSAIVRVRADTAVARTFRDRFSTGFGVIAELTKIGSRTDDIGHSVFYLFGLAPLVL